MWKEAARSTNRCGDWPMLKNPRHEAFAQAIARGASIDASYIEAGYARNSSNASRLANGNERIIARVAQLRSLVREMQIRSTHRVVLNREWIVEQLIGVAIAAKAQYKPDLAGAIKALHLLGLELGMFVERKEQGKPGEFDGLTIADKRERVLSIAKHLGLVPGRGSGGSFLL